MSLPLDIGDTLIDKDKSSLYLYYLTRAFHREELRTLHHKKTELAIKRLKKLSTKNIHKHLDELHRTMKEALAREWHIQHRQEHQADVHQDLKHKIGKLEHKLTRYLTSQEARKRRIQALEEKIKHKFDSKQDRLKQLKTDYRKLLALYTAAKKAKTDKNRLLTLARRLDHIKQRIASLE